MNYFEKMRDWICTWKNETSTPAPNIFMCDDDVVFVGVGERPAGVKME